VTVSIVEAAVESLPQLVLQIYRERRGFSTTRDWFSNRLVLGSVGGQILYKNLASHWFCKDCLVKMGRNKFPL